MLEEEIFVEDSVEVKDVERESNLVLRNADERTILKLWHELGVISKTETRNVRYCDFGLDLNWLDLKEKLQQCAQKEFEANLSEVDNVLKLQRAKKMAKVGSVWKRREGAAGAYADRSKLWIRRILALDNTGVLRYFDGLTMDDWSNYRGEMIVGLVRSKQVTNDVLDALSHPPSPYLFSVEAQEPTKFQWLFCVEDESELMAWREALSKHTTRQDANIILHQTKSIDYQIGTATEDSTSKRQSRYFILETSLVSASVDAALLGIIDALHMEADARFARRLADREEMQIAHNQKAAAAAPLTQLDLRLGSELLASRLITVRKRLDEARRAFKTRLLAARNKLDKMLDLVRASYDQAKFFLAEPEAVRMPPATKDFLLPLIETWDLYDSKDYVQDQVSRAQDSVTPEESNVIEQFFAHASDVGTACRSARRALAARTTAVLCDSIEDCIKATEAIAMVKLSEHTETQISAMDKHALDLCRGFDLAVTSNHAWVGPDSATAKLWTVHRETSKTRDPALCCLSAMNSLIPGSLFLGTRALFFLPSNTLGGVFARALKASKPEPIRLDLLTDINSLDRVSSPVPLKKNALQITTANNHKYIFTLNTPGASVSATLDLVDACRRCLLSTPVTTATTPPPNTLPESALPINPPPLVDTSPHDGNPPDILHSSSSQAPAGGSPSLPQHDSLAPYAEEILPTSDILSMSPTALDDDLIQLDNDAFPTEQQSNHQLLSVEKVQSTSEVLHSPSVAAESVDTTTAVGRRSSLVEEEEDGDLL